MATARPSALGQLRRCYRSWPSLAFTVGLLHRRPSRVVLRDGTALGPPATLARVYALADAVSSGWTARGSTMGRVRVSPTPGVEFDCRWERGFDVENAVEVFKDRVYAGDVRGKAVIDVGASIGDSALFFAREGASRVLAFEPNEESWKLARENVAASPFGKVIELEPFAVSGSSGQRTLLFPSSVPNASSLSPVPQATARWEFDAEQHVDSVSLESVLGRLSPARVGLLKLDCQGAEYEILGATSASALRQVDAVILEFTQGVGILAEELRRAGFLVEHDPGTRGYLRATRPPGESGT